MKEKEVCNMRKIYEKYLYIPEQGKGKVKEHVFFARLALSVVIIVFCMCAIGYNAYAYFSTSIGTTQNSIQAAGYTLEITPSVAVEGTGSVAITNTAEHKYTLQPGRYYFKLVKPVTATASTGYCRIDVGDGEGQTSFYTEQIGIVAGQDAPIAERTITISVDKETVVQFTPCWGTYAGATTNLETYLSEGKAIQMLAGKTGLVEATIFQTVASEPVQQKQEELKTKEKEEETNTQETDNSPVVIQNQEETTSENP
jgi:hypothetical protein